MCGWKCGGDLANTNTSQGRHHHSSQVGGRSSSVFLQLQLRTRNHSHKYSETRPGLSYTGSCRNNCVHCPVSQSGHLVWLLYRSRFIMGMLRLYSQSRSTGVAGLVLRNIFEREPINGGLAMKRILSEI